MDKKHIISLFILMSLFVNLQSNAQEAPNPAVIYNEAIDLYGQDKVENSIELFSKAIELNPEFYEAHYNLAQILMSLGRNEEALKSLEAILKLKPNDPETLYNIGKIQYSKGYLSSAYESLKKISVSSAQYDSAKLLISKIEARQDELNLEKKIKERKVAFDSKGLALGQVISEIPAPSGIAVDNRGNIFNASFSQNLIYKISIFGQKTVFSKSGLIKGPIGLAIDKDNNIYVANYSANNILKITPNGITSIFAEIQKPYCLFYDAEHHRIYVGEQNTNKLIKYDL